MKTIIWKEEQGLLVGVVAAFVMLCFVEARLPVVTMLQGTAIETLLVSDDLKNIFSGLLVSIIAAYVFYIFIDVVPRFRKHRDTMMVLNALLCSILDSYNRCRVFGHETALPYVDTSALSETWLADNREKLKQSQSLYLPLLLAMQTAHTRQESFQHSLILASSLSPKHAMQWLVILDKVRLFAESYGENPEVPMGLTQLVDSDSDDNPVKDFKSTLNFRMLEFIEEVENWIKVENQGK
ncbi:hypothetical protein PYE51_17665 [Vibrio aestuarianus]|uniref:DUF4126 domain-containing protein n=1 Tax=Vibrio aestuarianus TaxID=28171 RepID=A0AAX3U6Z5_9VIBR|nr:hypothetical protein [Vibrio aestuarianus]WGK83189.1 hypothetical protein PYE51_17665 [Vibrio aestuarianus]